jgi:hypothetical protein
MNSPSPEPARLDPLAVVAFARAVLLMVVPVEAYILILNFLWFAWILIYQLFR